MACLSDETWAASLSNKLADCASLREQEHGGDRPTFLPADSLPFGLERVFPVYAVGSSAPAAVAPDFGDPIWDAVREEAKLEVRLSNTLRSFHLPSEINQFTLLGYGFFLILSI